MGIQRLSLETAGLSGIALVITYQKGKGKVVPVFQLSTMP
jgi:hypothetical protein